MRSLLILAPACLALSACTSTGSIDTAIQTNLPKACQIAETAYVAFSAVAATAKIKPRTIAKAETAYVGIAIVCADPAHVTASDALIRVVSASVVISTALKEAQGSG